MYNQKQIKSVSEVLKKNKTNYWTGDHGRLFEREFSKYHGVKYSVCVSNGSVALEIVLKALNLKKTAVVIVPPRSFIISASCVLNVGLKPIFADVDLNGNVNIEGIRRAYKPGVKAIILVHLNGLSCDLDPIVKFAKEKKLYLIEDCSQAHGAIYKGKKVGSFGDIATWSFCQDKIISTGGEGGMISTNSKKLFLTCWSIKDHGKNYNSVFYKKHKTGFRWLHDNLGSNYRMTEMQAALGREQLKSLDNQLHIRNRLACLYINGLKNFYIKYNLLKKPDFKCQNCPLKQKTKSCAKCRHAYYKLNLFINSKKIDQIKLIEQLNKNDINCSVGSCPEIYREKVFKKIELTAKFRLNRAKILGKTSLVFPINPLKKIKLIKKEIFVIKKILNNFIKKDIIN